MDFALRTFKSKTKIDKHDENNEFATNKCPNTTNTCKTNGYYKTDWETHAKESP